MPKSSLEEIRRRFDADVERFSNLETGQTATMDARLAMDLIAQAALAVTPQYRSVLDLGCGAGNYALRLQQQRPPLDVTLVDLSQPMLSRACERLQGAGAGRLTTFQGDVAVFPYPDQQFDVIVAAAVLHHLRTDEQWDHVFASCFRALKPGGSFWIFDLVDASHAAIGQLMRQRYGTYLTELRDERYRDEVFAYIEREDTPRPVYDQLRRLERAGFRDLEVLHKQACFAAFGGCKPSRGSAT